MGGLAEGLGLMAGSLGV